MKSRGSKAELQESNARARRLTSHRPLLLWEERKIAADLQAKNLTYSQIASFMGISVIRARDLCRQHARQLLNRSKHTYEQELSKRALSCLLNGRPARWMTGDKSARLKRLLEIAACYTREQLIEEANVGRQTFLEIEWWLIKKGLALRAPSQTISDALDRVAAVTAAASERSPDEPASLKQANDEANSLSERVGKPQSTLTRLRRKVAAVKQPEAGRDPEREPRSVIRSQ